MLRSYLGSILVAFITLCPPAHPITVRSIDSEKPDAYNSPFDPSQCRRNPGVVNPWANLPILPDPPPPRTAERIANLTTGLEAANDTTSLPVKHRQLVNGNVDDPYCFQVAGYRWFNQTSFIRTKPLFLGLSTAQYWLVYFTSRDVQVTVYQLDRSETGPKRKWVAVYDQYWGAQQGEYAIPGFRHRQMSLDMSLPDQLGSEGTDGELALFEVLSPRQTDPK